MSPVISGGAGGGALSGVTVTGTAAAGDVPVASSSSAGTWALPPGYEFGYDEITSGVNVTGTTSAAPTTIITCAAHTFDGGIVEALLQASLFVGNVAGQTVAIALYESSTLIDLFGNVQGNNAQFVQLQSVRLTPTAGSHSYLVKAWCANGTSGTPAVAAGAHGSNATPPASVRFIKV